MKKLFLYILLFFTILSGTKAQGIPSIRNYFASEYKAHNRNFDITIGLNGIVYVANFEGLLYFDNAEWRIIHTPSITRLTAVTCDSKGIVWVGGYNFVGYVATDNKGAPYLKNIGQSNEFRGEIIWIWDNNGEPRFLSNKHEIYGIHNNRLVLKKGEKVPTTGNSIFSEEKDITQKQELENGLYALATNGRGIIITDEEERPLYSITEDNGLCSNNVNHIKYNRHGLLWGATDNGVFSIAVPSIYSHFSPMEGLKGEVFALATIGQEVYAGTLNGLFIKKGKSFSSVPGIDHACWFLTKQDNSLLAASSNGVYRILQGGIVKQLTSQNTLTILADGNKFYTGELNGLYIQDDKGNRQLISEHEKIIKIYKDNNGVIWLQDIYGQIFTKHPDDNNLHRYKVSSHSEELATIVELDGRITVVNTETAKPFPYPQFSYSDNKNTLWLTNNKGKELYSWHGGKATHLFRRQLFPLKDITTRSLLRLDEELWIGNDYGITIINTSDNDPILNTEAKLLLRSVSLNSDSILWGGFGDIPQNLSNLNSRDRNLKFTFSLDYTPLVGRSLYRYRMNDGQWSMWKEETDAEFFNLPYGNHTFQVEAIDATGRKSNTISVIFNIELPVYLRWYMISFYLLLGVLLIYLLMKFRLQRLEKEKLKLEQVVQERTAEVVKQKDEIQEKSESLEKALSDLSNAQEQLIRQEKLATMGKLTQGLIDRILNPLNYINNFSKLSEGLIKDVEANIEDDKENIDQENYEDTIDILNMLKENQQKVYTHGQNTTRTLKAMEEMLKDRTGGVVKTDITSLLIQDEKMLNNYYAKDIAEFHINIKFDYPKTPVYTNANPELLSKVFMSILANSMYAVTKKAQRLHYHPEISLETSTAKDIIRIKIRDNGIGIEETIIPKIFDPFFTTKTTGEATGIGLYLSHDVIQNYGGSISVESVKDEYSVFTITLPLTK